MSTLRALPVGIDPRQPDDIDALERAAREAKRREVDAVLTALWNARPKRPLNFRRKLLAAALFEERCLQHERTHTRCALDRDCILDAGHAGRCDIQPEHYL